MRRKLAATAMTALVLVCAAIIAIVPLVLSPGGGPGGGQDAGTGVNSSSGPESPQGDSPASAEVDHGQVDESTLGQAYGFENYVKLDIEDESSTGTEQCDEGECQSGRVLASLPEGSSLDEALAQLNRIDGLEGIAAVKQTDRYVKFALPDGLAVQDAIDLMEGEGAVTHVQAELMYTEIDGASGAQVDAGSTGAEPSGATAAEASTDAQLQAFSAAVVARSVAGTDLGDALGVEPQSFTLAYPPNDPKWSTGQWGLKSYPGVSIENAWRTVAEAESTGASAPVVIAVIDGGFNLYHEDFAAGTFVSPYNATTRESTPYLNAYSDHGTHVTGIIAAATNNGKGIAGVTYNQCKIMPVKVRDDKGETKTSNLVDAFTYVDRKKKDGVNVRVVNISMGHESAYAANGLADGDFFLYQAVSQAYDDGVVTVAAAGNDGGATPPYYEYPGDFDRVVSVVNTDDRGVRSSSSNYNVSGQRAKGISAPGQGIWSLWNTNSAYAQVSGTSMASPMVAGIAGLMLTKDPTLTPDMTVSKLYSSTSQAGWSNQTGYGIVDASKAVNIGEDATYLVGKPVMTAGTTQMMRLGYRDVFSQVIFPFTETSVEWSSSDPSVVSVMEGQGGSTQLTANKAGQVTISAKRGNRTAKQTVTVYDNTASLHGDEVVPVGAMVTYWVESYPVSEWTFTSSNALAGTIDSNTGDFTARGNVHATTTITATPKAGSPMTEPVSMTVQIVSNDLSSSDYSITLPATSYTYSGRACTPKPTVKMGKYILEEGADYTLDYSNNTDSGTADVYVRRAENSDFAGFAKRSFTINKAPMSSANIILSATSYTYDGAAKSPSVTVYDIGSRARNRLAASQYSVASRKVVLGSGTVTVSATSNCQNFTGSVVRTFTVSAQKVSMYRMYNPNSGEHFYTANASERDSLRSVGWKYEGLGWTAPRSVGSAVYRMYNPNAGDHHYTTSAAERDSLRRVGWRYEGVGWYSDSQKHTPLYRLYNPNAVAGAHHYTTSAAERDSLRRVGWRTEGIGWYGM